MRRAAFFLDGSSVRMPHNEALCAAYPPGSSQHGESHWPLLRILVAHDLYTGLAMRPQWGAMNGQEAVSEQGLLEQAMERLPRGAGSWSSLVLANGRLLVANQSGRVSVLAASPKFD